MTDCPRSHLYLREILPRLKDRLHDIIEGTRIAMMDLLLVRLQWDFFLVPCPVLFLCITFVRQLNTQVLDHSGNLITKQSGWVASGPDSKFDLKSGIPTILNGPHNRPWWPSGLRRHVSNSISARDYNINRSELFYLLSCLPSRRRREE